MSFSKFYIWFGGNPHACYLWVNDHFNFIKCWINNLISGSKGATLHAFFQFSLNRNCSRSLYLSVSPPSLSLPICPPSFLSLSICLSLLTYKKIEWHDNFEHQKFFTFLKYFLNLFWYLWKGIFYQVDGFFQNFMAFNKFFE